MIKTMMPKDFQPGDYFEFPGVETWFKVSHVTVFADESAVVWTINTDDQEDVCPFSKDEGPFIVFRTEN